MPFRPRKQSLGCSVAEKCFNKVPKLSVAKTWNYSKWPPSPPTPPLLPPCAFVRKCKMQRLKSIVCCTPQRLDSYLFKQSTDRCWARCARCAWCARCSVPGVSSRAPCANQKHKTNSFDNATRRHQPQNVKNVQWSGGYGIVTGVGVNPEKTGSVRLNESELSWIQLSCFSGACQRCIQGLN